MGMFDYITYKGEKYQTKDTPHQSLENYKIETDHDSGHTYLWCEAYNAKYVDTDDSIFGTRLETWNHRWECCHDFDGVIDFYRGVDTDWEEYHSLFMDGKLLKIEKIDNDNENNSLDK